MNGLIDPAELEREIDEAYTAEIRYELDQRLKQAFLDWGRQFSNTALFYAIYDAGRGYWDNVRNDLRQGRITLEQGNMIADNAVRFKLITPRQAEYYEQQFLEIAR